MMTKNTFVAVVMVSSCGLWSGSSLALESYNPLDVPSTAKSQTVDLTVRDEDRSREIPLRIYLPVPSQRVPSQRVPSQRVPSQRVPSQRVPVVLFSHGLGGTCKGGTFLGKHWSARGYVAVFLQHPGSDERVWKGQPLVQRMVAMKRAASGKNYMLRVQDVPAVLDRLEAWNQERGHPLHERLNLRQVGMSGHSFGAVTTQAVSGQAAGILGQRFTDKRIQAAIALSPSSPRRGNLATAFGSVKIPWMLMTGTQDTSIISSADVASRLNVYPHLPAGIDKYELVLHNAEHSAFTERALPGDRQPRNANHHRAILALSTAFWDTHLREDPAARQWLEGVGPRSVLEEQDRWQTSVRKGQR